MLPDATVIHYDRYADMQAQLVFSHIHLAVQNVDSLRSHMVFLVLGIE